MGTQPTPTVELQVLQARVLVEYNDLYCDLDSQSVDGAHIHSCYEIYVNLSGDISFLHGDSIYAIQPADVIFSRPGDVHCCIYHSSCLHEHICIWFESEDPATAAFIERLAIAPHVRLAERDRADLLRLVRLLAEREIDPVLQTAYFIEMLSCLRTGERAERTVTGEGDGQVPEKVREILAYVERSYLQRLTSGQIAAAFFLSESTLNRLFRQHVGISVAHLIEAKRLSHAEKLLRADATVTEACFRSGFSDCSRFIACFRKRFGMTPLQYKKALFK